jgi:D-alanyl-D-alanine carboxypeptidase
MRDAFMVFLCFSVCSPGLAFSDALMPAQSNVPDPAAKSKQVDELFQAVSGQTPGASVIVVKQGTVVHRKGYGMADVEAGIPNHPDTRFCLGSVTKSFTALAILQLQESGLLKIEDPVSNYLPDFPHASRMKIRHLLTHTAGVPDFMSYEEAKEKPLDFEPGERVSYSNIGYLMLGRIIEKVSGKPYQEYLQDQIFVPLGLVNSGYDEESLVDRRAAGYLNAASGFQRTPREAMAGAYAAGALFSSVEDLRRWDEAFAAGKIIKTEMVREALTPGRLNDGRDGAFGFGWMISRHKGLLKVHHGGDITGFNAEVSHFPEQQLAVFVLSNLGMRPPGPLPSSADLADKIAEIYLGDQMKEEPVTVVAIDPALYDLYAGVYEIDAPEVVLREGGRTFLITREEDRFFGEGKLGKAELFAESETVFRVEGSPMKLIFSRGADGQVNDLLFSFMGVREFRAHRVK